ncbi:MAG TPA: DUF2274 domain-containing protein [Sphingomonas sp.]|nr:DUF2274 domain-containing protein [Sphingomonas sp.]
MAGLKLTGMIEDKPVRIALELPGSIHRDLVRYAAALSEQSGQPPLAPEKLIGPMIERFMATDREFAKARRRPAAGSG